MTGLCGDGCLQELPIQASFTCHCMYHPPNDWSQKCIYFIKHIDVYDLFKYNIPFACSRHFVTFSIACSVKRLNLISVASFISSIYVMEFIVLCIHATVWEKLVFCLRNCTFNPGWAVPVHAPRIWFNISAFVWDLRYPRVTQYNQNM